MSDITEAVTQQAIADSILDDSNIVGSWTDQALSENPIEQAPTENEERLADLQTDRERPVDKEAQPEDARERQPEPQEQQAEPQQATPEAIYEGIQKLDATIQKYELNDPATARTFATEFCEAFGTSAFNSGVNAEALGSVMAKTVFSAAAIYDAARANGGQLPAMAPESARAFTYDFLRSFGVDPRGVQVDERVFAETALIGTMNLIDTYNRFGGKVTSLDQLNDPAMAEQFLAGINKAFGIDGPVDRVAALRVADACGKYVLSFLGKLQQVQPEPTPQRASRRSSSGQRQSGRRWKTNDDIFNGAQEMLDDQKTGAAHPGRKFDPSERPRTARFKTNADIFDEETLASFSGRL